MRKVEIVNEHFLETRNEASEAAAQHIVKLLTGRLNAQGEASLVVSGGNTPVKCFTELSEAAIDWLNVHVILSDERWVPADSDESNEKLVRQHLLKRFAARAHFVPAYESGANIVERCEDLAETIRLHPFPFACCLLGMGEDGHFASLFPDASNLKQGLDVDSRNLCLPVTTAASPHERISLTLSAISRSDEIVLLIFGERKREVFERAKAGDLTLPVTHLIRNKRAPVSIYWAP